jgi:hypothetical protein
MCCIFLRVIIYLPHSRSNGLHDSARSAAVTSQLSCTVRSHWGFTTSVNRDIFQAACNVDPIPGVTTQRSYRKSDGSIRQIINAWSLGYPFPSERIGLAPEPASSSGTTQWNHQLRTRRQVGNLNKDRSHCPTGLVQLQGCGHISLYLHRNPVPRTPNHRN